MATATWRSKTVVFVALPLFGAILFTIIGTAGVQFFRNQAEADREARAKAVIDAFPPALIAYQSAKREVDSATGKGLYPARLIQLLEVEPPLIDIETFPGGGWRYDNDAGYLFSREFIVLYRRATFDGEPSYVVEVRRRFSPERVLLRIAPDGSLERNLVKAMPILGQTQAL